MRMSTCTCARRFRSLLLFKVLQVNQVSGLRKRAGAGGSRRGCAGLPLEELPEGAACVLIAPPRGTGHLIAECRRVRVVAAVPLDFRTACLWEPRTRHGGTSFLTALRYESPRWSTVPEPPAPLSSGGGRHTPVRFLIHQARFHVGDALWLTPLLREIARRFRHAEVTVVGPPAAAQALEGNPRVSRLVLLHPEDGEAGQRRVLMSSGVLGDWR